MAKTVMTGSSRNGSGARAAYSPRRFEMDKSLMETAKAFMASDDWKAGIANATRASWGGGGCSVELFRSGSWRLLWDSTIGNLYQSDGIIVALPIANDEDADMNDPIDFEMVVDFAAIEECERWLNDIKESMLFDAEARGSISLPTPAPSEAPPGGRLRENVSAIIPGRMGTSAQVVCGRVQYERNGQPALPVPRPV
jgi:hypothetical protein